MSINWKKIQDELAGHGINTSPEIPLHRIENSYRWMIDCMTYLLGKKPTEIAAYHRVADWLSDNRHKGLLLYGAVGTGKTLLAKRVIPMLFYHLHNKIIHTFSAYQIANKEVLDRVMRYRYNTIDDMGTEGHIMDYGTELFPIEKLIDHAEQQGNMLILTTNLDGQSLRERYNQRVVDRLNSNYLAVKFEGGSFRK